MVSRCPQIPIPAPAASTNCFNRTVSDLVNDDLELVIYPIFPSDRYLLCRYRCSYYAQRMYMNLLKYL